MHQTNITVKYVNQPDKKPDYGSVKDAEGKYWSVPKNLLQAFAENTEYAIGYTTFTGKDGRDYHTIKEVKPLAKPNQSNGHAPNGHKNGDGRQMFVCALLKEWMNKIPVGETTTVISAIECLSDAYDATFGK